MIKHEQSHQNGTPKKYSVIWYLYRNWKPTKLRCYIVYIGNILAIYLQHLVIFKFHRIQFGSKANCTHYIQNYSSKQPKIRAIQILIHLNSPFICANCLREEASLIVYPNPSICKKGQSPFAAVLYALPTGIFVTGYSLDKSAYSYYKCKCRVDITTNLCVTSIKHLEPSSLGILVLRIRIK